MKQLNTEQFDELLKGGKPVVCDFFATWCGPCKMLAPVMEQAEQSFGDRAEFVKVDVDECTPLASRYRIMSIPLVAIFKDGVIFAKSLGYVSKSEMEEFLKANL